MALGLRIMTFEFWGENRKTGERKLFTEKSTWRYGALDKLNKTYGEEWKFEY